MRHVIVQINRNTQRTNALSKPIGPLRRDGVPRPPRRFAGVFVDFRLEAAVLVEAALFDVRRRSATNGRFRLDESLIGLLALPFVRAF